MIPACPRCGTPGEREDVATDGTIIWKCPACVNHGVGIDDVPYTFPLFFGDDGKVYI